MKKEDEVIFYEAITNETFDFMEFISCEYHNKNDDSISIQIVVKFFNKQEISKSFDLICDTLMKSTSKEFQRKVDVVELFEYSSTEFIKKIGFRKIGIDH